MLEDQRTRWVLEPILIRPDAFPMFELYLVHFSPFTEQISGHQMGAKPWVVGDHFSPCAVQPQEQNEVLDVLTRPFEARSTD